MTTFGVTGGYAWDYFLSGWRDIIKQMLEWYQSSHLILVQKISIFFRNVELFLQIVKVILAQFQRDIKR